MATGRPDYNLKVIPIPETIGDDEERYSKRGHSSCEPLTYTYLINIQAPSDADLYLTHLMINNKNPYLMRLQVQKDSESLIWYYFDKHMLINLPGSVGIYVPANSYFQVIVTNMSIYWDEAWCVVFGYKKYI